MPPTRLARFLRKAGRIGPHEQPVVVWLRREIGDVFDGLGQDPGVPDGAWRPVVEELLFPSILLSVTRSPSSALVVMEKNRAQLKSSIKADRRARSCCPLCRQRTSRG